MVVGQQLGRAIKSRRLDLGQTQDQAAEAISALAGERVSKATFSEWERGKSAPHPRNIGPLSEWMGQPVSRVAAMAEDAELPAGHHDEDLLVKVQALTVHLADIEAEVQRLAAENVAQQRLNLEQQRDINKMLVAVLESLAKRI